MKLTTFGGITYYQFDNLSQHANVVHGVFARTGGISKGPFASLNAGFLAGDSVDTVNDNRRLICEALDIDYLSLVVTRQVHGHNVATIDAITHVQQPEEWYYLLPPSDAMITMARERYMMMTFADCVPLLFYDPVRQVAGIAHGGWRGTVNRVAQHTIEAMVRELGSTASDIIAAIGPAIGPCCYEVGDEVIATARKAFANADEFLVPGPKGSVHFDLWEANRWQLLQAGIASDHVETAGMCTACGTDTFFSHRAERGQTGRFGVLIGLR